MHRAGLLLLVLLAACGNDSVRPGDAGPASTTTSVCAHLPPEQGGCGLTFEEQRRLNLRYADRIDFSGDAVEAREVADEVREALQPLVGILPYPSVDQVRDALARWEPRVQVIDNAVRTQGTAFAVEVDGGCVFGSVHDGQLEIEIGGYINDGGCLAAYGH